MSAELSREEKRHAICIACGWERSGPKGNIWKRPDWYNGPCHGSDGHVIPNWFEDRNAIAEAIRAMPVHKRVAYGPAIRKSVVAEATPDMRDLDDPKLLCDVFFYEATAAQKAEAYGLAMGLWT